MIETYRIETYRMRGRYHEDELAGDAERFHRARETSPVVRSRRRSNGALLRFLAKLVLSSGLTAGRTKRIGTRVAIEREEP
jgi:hypothetical protein